MGTRFARRLEQTLLIFAIAVAPLASASAQATKGQGRGKPPLAVDRVRILAAPKGEKALVGGKITGSNTSASEGFQVLAEIKQPPAPGAWEELTIPDAKPYRWIRYEGPAGSSGRISKLEFFAGPEKLTGQIFASFPSGNFRSVLDDKPNNGVSGGAKDGQFVGIDIGDKASCRRVIVAPPGGEVSTEIQVTLRCPMPGATIRYTTDGTLPTATNGRIYSGPIAVAKTSAITAVAFAEGLAPSPATDAVYQVRPVPRRNTLHFGNSLTGNALGKFALHVGTTGTAHNTRQLLMGGGLTRTLWNTAMIGVGDPKDQARWKDLFTTHKSMGGVATYPVAQVERGFEDWKKLWASAENITDVTFQPRDADIAEEADYTIRWLKLVRSKFPEVQPWLYVEWDEMDRRRATDQGLVPSRQMKTLPPALTWEESMSAMMVYGEDVQYAIRQAYPEGKSPRIIPVALAMGWIHHQIEHGAFPGVGKQDFYPLLFSDRVHITPEGSYLVEATWYAALYGRTPEATLLPTRLELTPDQARAMQRLAWDVVKNYPDCGLYEPGTTPCEKPQFSPAPAGINADTRIELTSATPGAWFRYTLDGTEPSRTRGYIYCGAISARPGMTIKAIAYRSGMADSPAVAATYPAAK